MRKQGLTRVWELSNRVLHWALAVGFAAAYYTYDIPGPWHEWLGYAVLGIVAIRVVLGFRGGHYSRFRQFLRPVPEIRDYGRALLRWRQPRYLGHNPLGGVMIIALLLMVSLTCLSGWLYTTDRYWGVAWVEDLHDGLSWITIGMIVLHIAGVIATSMHDRENLVGSMIHGYKKNRPDRASGGPAGD